MENKDSSSSPITVDGFVQSLWDKWMLKKSETPNVEKVAEMIAHATDGMSQSVEAMHRIEEILEHYTANKDAEIGRLISLVSVRFDEGKRLGFLETLPRLEKAEAEVERLTDLLHSIANETDYRNIRGTIERELKR